MHESGTYLKLMPPGQDQLGQPEPRVATTALACFDLSWAKLNSALA